MGARLRDLYNGSVQKSLQERFEYKNLMQVPKIVKIVLNMGVGEATRDRKLIDGALSDLTAIAGQKPVVTRARKSIAGFKLREGMVIGCKATLRSDRMYEFLDRLVNIALPRVRDFRGLRPGGFDGRGNYNMGLQEQIVFPEIDYDAVDKIRGLNVAICTTARTDQEGQALFEGFGAPFVKAHGSGGGDG